MRRAGELALALARTPVGGTLASAALLPVHRLRRSAGVLVIRHPRPQYPVHLLLLPRRRVRDYLAASPDLVEKVLAVATDIRRRDYPDSEIQIVTNLGRYQEVRLLHFHFVGGLDPSDARGVPTTVAEAPNLARAVLQQRGVCRVVFRPAAGADYSVFVR